MGIYRALRLAFDAYAHEAPRNKREAEHTLASRSQPRSTASSVGCASSIFIADFSFNGPDEDEVVAEHLRLLAGVLALCLWRSATYRRASTSAGWCRSFSAWADGFRYVRVKRRPGRRRRPISTGARGAGPSGASSSRCPRGRMLEDATRGAPAPSRPGRIRPGRRPPSRRQRGGRGDRAVVALLASTDIFRGVVEGRRGQPVG